MKNIYNITSYISLFKLLWVVIAFLIIQVNSFAGQYDRYVVGTVIKVRDGDTVQVRVANTDEMFEVRLYGINTPEKNKPLFAESAEFLKLHILGKLVELYISGKDRYNRHIAKVYHNSQYINLMLISSVLATHYKKYAKDKDLALAEAEARRCRIGIWGNNKSGN